LHDAFNSVRLLRIAFCTACECRIEDFIKLDIANDMERAMRGADAAVKRRADFTLVCFCVQSTWAQDEAEAQHLLDKLVLVVDNQEVRADGPQKAENTRINSLSSR
jgi:hypothetical protein